MKILQLIQAKQYRGAEIFCCQLSNHLLDMGHQVEIISIFEGNAALPFRGNIKSLNRRKNKRHLDFQGWKKLTGFIQSYEPDVIQANAADTLKYIVLSKLIYRWRAPIIYRNASTSSFYITNPVVKAYNNFLLKEVDLILSVSHASKKDLNTVFPSTSSKTLVIPVGVENMVPAVVAPLSVSKKNIIHIGSFTKEKNHKEVIEIFSEVVEGYSGSATLHLFGEGPLCLSIQEYVEQAGLKSKVKFKGVRKNSLDYIRAADVLILPSIIEGLPAVLLEAMYCKTPVVAYNVGGISEIVTPKTGHLIAKNDIGAFSEAIRTILEQPDQDQIENAYNMVLKDYMNRKIACKFVKAYEKVTGKKCGDGAVEK